MGGGGRGGERRLGGVEVRMYSITEESIFNLKKKKRKNEHHTVSSLGFTFGFELRRSCIAPSGFKLSFKFLLPRLWRRTPPLPEFQFRTGASTTGSVLRAGEGVVLYKQPLVTFDP